MTNRMRRNTTLFSAFRFFQNLIFWQATWFLFFQETLSAAEAVLLYVVYDIAATVLEVPSGWMSDRLGRRLTLMIAAIVGGIGALCLGFGAGFAVFAAGQALLGASTAFSSGTDSAFLYESLRADGRADEVEAAELRVWQIGFAAFALSAVSGGAMALYGPTLPFFGAAIAYAVMAVIAVLFVEPPREVADRSKGAALASLRAAFAQPLLRWIFALSVLMYGYSHLPFVFGQPAILNALGSLGFAGEAPLVSGATTAVMMLISVIASTFALGLLRQFGLGPILLFAFGLQIVLAGTLAATDSLFVIGVLILRMVPDALSRPFIIARIQPHLADDSRATFLSLQSLAGRLLFAASLMLTSGSASNVGAMTHSEIQVILGIYVSAGLLALVMLALTVRSAGVSDQEPS